MVRRREAPLCVKLRLVRDHKTRTVRCAGHHDDQSGHRRIPPIVRAPGRAMTRPTNAAAPPNIRKHLMTFIRDTPTARRFRRFASALLGSTALIGLAMAGAARADETWTGATSSDWFDASNWSPATVPTAAVNVFVDRGGGVGAGTPSAITGSSASAATVTIGVNSLGLLDVENGGSLTTGTVTLGVNIGAYGALGVSNGGTITSSGSLVIGNLGVGDAQFTDTGSQVMFAHDA